MKLPAIHLSFRQMATPFNFFVVGLLLMCGIGSAAGLMVMTQGLWLTNLSDLVPWGLWITIDLSSIALSAGAFILCAAVYLLGLKQFQPVARTATFIGLVGYSMAMLCLLLDIGRPERFWHGWVYWNPHSVLWEVTMCISLYFTVLMLETAPIVGQTSFIRQRFPWLSHRLESVHHLAPILAVVGLGLSSLHQSSLGATYGILKARPIWFRPDLSVLFIISAIAAGMSFTLLVTMLAGRFNRSSRVDDKLVEKLAYFIGWVLVVFLYFRFWDAFSMTYTVLPGRSEGLRFLTRGPLAFNFWVGEIGLGLVVPIFLLLNKRTRQNQVLRMIAFGLVVGGLVAYRWDVVMAGQLVLLTYLPNQINALYTTYFPSLVEFLSGAGVVAYGILAISLGVRFLNIVDHTHLEEHVTEPQALPAAAD
jgi:Ni/Fe-hydrogenase subunit HybB-like protein